MIPIYVEPWVNGMRSDLYCGPVRSDVFIAESDCPDRDEALERGEMQMLQELSDQAEARGANTVVGLEVTADPFSHHPDTGKPGCWISGIGTASRLIPFPV